jgi:hypothetical protein
VAIETLVGSNLTEPIGSSNSANNIPPWAEAGSVAITRPKPRVKVLQWLRDVIGHVRSRTLEQDKAGFTCSDCPNPRAAYRSNDWTGEETSFRSALLWRWVSWETHYAERCKTCNTKYSRWKRARRAMQKITDRGMDIWFITLTRPNVTGVPALDHVQEIDRDMWIKDFKRFRRTKIWKDTFSGGYWFYEFTSHVPGDKIFAKDDTFIREVQDHEINGHLHILATSEGRIPMKELAAQWGDRVDFRQPKRHQDVMRYLRGYLIKCGTQGVNMRPFGDIHRSKQAETIIGT